MKKLLAIGLVWFLASSFLFFSKKDPEIEALKQIPIKRANGESVKFEEVEVFTCKNIPQTRFLFNKNQNKVCPIAGKEDESFMSSKLGGSYWGNNMVYFENCPASWSEQKTCNPNKLRKF